MRNWMLVLTAVMGLMFLTGCDPEDPSKARPTPTAAPKANPTQAKPNPNPDTGAEPGPGQQPPPPQADPGPYNDIHQVVVKVWWIGEHSGKVTVLKNGTEYSVEAAGTPRKGADGKYHGGYTKIVSGVNKHDNIELQWRASIAPKWAMLVIYHNARIAADVQSGQPNCSLGGTFCAIDADIL